MKYSSLSAWYTKTNSPKALFVKEDVENVTAFSWTAIEEASTDSSRLQSLIPRWEGHAEAEGRSKAFERIVSQQFHPVIKTDKLPLSQAFI